VFHPRGFPENSGPWSFTSKDDDSAWYLWWGLVPPGDTSSWVLGDDHHSYQYPAPREQQPTLSTLIDWMVRHGAPRDVAIRLAHRFNSTFRDVLADSDETPFNAPCETPRPSPPAVPGRVAPGAVE
jgi:hypothetical protein